MHSQAPNELSDNRKMFVDTKSPYNYQPNNEYGSDDSHSLSACGSASFCSEFSSTDSVEDFILTPTATPRGRPSLGDIKSENFSLQFPTPSTTPDHFTDPNNFCQVTSIGQDLMTGYQLVHHGQSFDSSVDISFSANYPNMVSPIHQSFGGNHGLPDCTPGLGFSSPPNVDTSFSENFVVPSQTHCQSMYMDVHSPIRPNSMGLVHQYDSPASSDYSSCLSATQSPMHDLSAYDMYESPSSTSGTPTRPSGLRNQRFAPLPSSVALHRVQDQAPKHALNTQQALDSYHRRVENMHRHDRKLRKRAEASSPSEVPTISFTHVEASKKACGWPGCDKKFKRQEHLKRHLRIHTEGPKDGFLCEFCIPKDNKGPKYFTRSDNWKSHIYLHTKKDASKRTPYHEEAINVYNSLASKPRTKKADSSSPLILRSRL